MSALRSGMDRKTAGKYLSQPERLRQPRPARDWRTRVDPLTEIWPEAELRLQTAPELEAKALFEHLQLLRSEPFPSTLLRTFQRRVAKVLLDRTRVAATIFHANAVKDRTRGIAIWQFMNFLHAQPPAKGLPIKRVMDRVRRLLLLGDDRDLRQLPAAAQSLDAVKLSLIWDVS